jgi:hypothetical protein
MISIVCGEKEASKLNMVPLSNDTIQRRIVEMSIDINEQLIDRIKNSGQFSMQLDETTDTNKCAQLMTYVRIIGVDNLEEHFLFCKSLDTTTRC